MWSHYSGNHTGFVIEFDENHAFFDQRKKENQIRGHLRKGRYSKGRPPFTFFNSKISDEDNIDLWVKDFIWLKNKDWEYEKEWRIIYTLRECEYVISDITPSIYLFPFPLEAIKKIIVGCKATQENKNKLQILLQSNRDYAHITLKEATIDDREFKLNIKELDI